MNNRRLEAHEITFTSYQLAYQYKTNALDPKQQRHAKIQVNYENNYTLTYVIEVKI